MNSSISIKPPIGKLPIWRAASAATVGSRHLERGTTCQDAAAAATAPRAFAVVCDGKGSSDVSQFGAQAAVAAMPAILASLEDSLAGVLDDEAALLPADQVACWRMVARFVIDFLRIEQMKLVKHHGGTESDFEFTVACAIAGTRFIGTLQVGDCVLAIERSGVLGLGFAPVAGEYVNETVFVGPAYDQDRDLMHSVFPAEASDGICVMTDGMAFHLADRQRALAATACRQLIEATGAGELSSHGLQMILESPRWSDRDSDDRAIALLAASTTPIDDDLTGSDDPQSPPASRS